MNFCKRALSTLAGLSLGLAPSLDAVQYKLEVSIKDVPWRNIALCAAGCGAAILLAKAAATNYSNSFITRVETVGKRCEQRYGALDVRYMSKAELFTQLITSASVRYFDEFIARLLADGQALDAAYISLEERLMSYTGEQHAQAFSLLQTYAALRLHMNALVISVKQNRAYFLLRYVVEYKPRPSYDVHVAYPAIDYVQKVDKFLNHVRELYTALLVHQNSSYEDAQLLMQARDLISNLECEKARLVEGFAYQHEKQMRSEEKQQERLRQEYARMERTASLLEKQLRDQKEKERDEQKIKSADQLNIAASSAIEITVS